MSTNSPARPQSSRRTLLTAALAGLAAGGTTYAVRASGGSATAADLAALPPLPDPVFAAVADLKAKAAGFEDASQVHDAPETDEEEALPDEVAAALVEGARLAWWEAEEAAFNTAPTTAAGLLCLLDAWWFVHVQDYGHHPDDGETVAVRLEAELSLRQIKAIMASARAFLAANGGRSA